MNKENKNDLKIDNRILKNNAAKKPDTEKPSTNLSAKRIIIALITNKKSPKVTKVAGKVKKTNNGLTNIFSNAITTATIMADKYPEMATPGKILDNKITAKAVNKILRKAFISWQIRIVM